MKDQVAAGMTVLMADDDAEDCMMTGKALAASGGVESVRFVGDGEELMDYLMRRGEYRDPRSSPRPAIILLDLNMPRKGGYAALEEMKTHLEIRQIPVVVFTTSILEEDIRLSYDRGASSFIRKPETYQGLVEAMKGFREYWTEVATLPETELGRGR